MRPPEDRGARTKQGCSNEGGARCLKFHASIFDCRRQAMRVKKYMYMYVHVRARNGAPPPMKKYLPMLLLNTEGLQ